MENQELRRPETGRVIFNNQQQDECWERLQVNQGRPEDVLLVLTADKRAAARWIYLSNINPRNVRVISKERQLAGLETSEMPRIYLEGFFSLGGLDAREIHHFLKYLDANGTQARIKKLSIR